MSRFDCSPTPIPGLYELQRKSLGDERGFLERMFCAQELNELFGKRSILQINRTLTRRQGTVRGLHFQHPPHAEMKLVTCLSGSVWDVAVDLREGSETFLKYHAANLSGENFKSLLIPEGVAHGFQTLEENCEMLYFHTAFYSKTAEAGMNAVDPRLEIDWPLPIFERSQRDIDHPMISSDYTGVVVI